MVTNDDYVTEILVDTGLITRSQLDRAREDSTPRHGIIQTLSDQGAVSDEDVSRALASAASMDFVDLGQITIPQEVIDMLPVETARRYKVIPVNMSDSAVLMATSNPLDFDTFDAIGHVLKRDIDFVCATPAQIKAALVRYYGTAEEAVSGLEASLGAETIQFGDGPVMDGDTQETGDAPVIKMVSMLLLEAHKMRASDIHLEPLEKRFRVRFRIDGVLHEMTNPPKKLQSAITSRIKIMTGSMSIAEKRLPQDGRIQVKIGKNSVDLRVSTIPTNHGESIVMRILDKSSLMLGLPELGFLSDDQAVWERMLALPDGILLVTGPTGSGKTTTLYGCLNYINRPDRKIITVEDPVEYQMNGINQVQVNADIGMTFPAALRSMLRQAPNIIMIGEIRDVETANIAINASLTGHLVFSTLHTNDAPGAVARLVDIGVQPFLVSSSVRAIMAQRLVRKLCNFCKAPGELTEPEMRALRIDGNQLSEATVMHPVGCEKCRFLGYKGRMGIFEICVLDDKIRRMINERMSVSMIRQRARDLGMRTLREDGLRKVLGGMTTPDEVITATVGDKE